MEYTAQNLEYAVGVFYNGEQSERTKAHAWLTSAQRVPQAWNFVWELLQPRKGTEVQFYAATTLHTKILRCWNEVPPDSYEELKNNILQAVLAYSKGPKIVTNRLCISLAAFILQQGTQDLATILRPLSTAENSTLLLEVLTVIPEEFNSMTMGSVLRNKNRVILLQACPRVLDDMLRYLQTVYNDYSTELPSDEMIQSWLSAATCASSWLSLVGEDAPEIPGGTLPDRIPLCRALLAIVQLLYSVCPAVCGIALDASEACLAGVRAAGAGAGPARHPHTALLLMSDIAALAAPIMARDNVQNCPNEDLLCAFVTCMVAIGECHAHAIVQAVESQENTEAVKAAQQFIQLLLAAQGAPGHYPINETRSNFVFGFWYTLQDEIANMTDGTKEMHNIWREVFSSLLTILVTKSEAAEDTTMSKDEQELLRCYRQDVADTVMYCYGVLGEWCWSPVEAAYTSASGSRAQEAALHVFGALAEAAPPQRAPPALLALLRHALHLAHHADELRVLNTALDCLGVYASWVGWAGGPALGGECVRAAGAALGRAAPAAALALRKLATAAAAPAAELAHDIVQAAQSDVGGTDAWVRRQLISAAGAALSAAELEVAMPLLQELARTLENDLRIEGREARSCSAGAELAAALMTSLDARAQLAAELFRLLAPALPPYAEHAALVQPLFNFLKSTVSSLMEHALPFMTDIARLIVTGFHTQPCPSGTEVVRLSVLMLGPDFDGTQSMFVTCVMLTSRALSYDPSAKSDLTEGLFGMLQAVTKKRPNYIDWLEELLPDLVELACRCIRMWEAGASRAACGWLAGLAALRPRVLQPQAAALTHLILGCIGGLTPRNQISHLAELLLSLNRATWEDGEDLASWLRTALDTPNFPTVHATDPHKHKFLVAVIKEKSNKRKLLETVQEFSLVCRGLVDTEYARQTLASKQLVT